MDNMLEYVLIRLAQTRGKWPAVAAATGISLRTLRKIGSRETQSPRICNVQALYDYFRAREEQQDAA